MDGNGRVALVTGGGRGIGRAISIGLADDGFDVAVNYRRDKDAADETAAEITARGRRGESFRASVDSLEDTQVMVDAVVAGFGQLDTVVHNAGVTNRGRTSPTPSCPTSSGSWASMPSAPTTCASSPCPICGRGHGATSC
jgi:NAD(P)-dependent dehydrogenase (short-subunit alcohol dehydrogenase family)